jgi:hypothetical protein
MFYRDNIEAFNTTAAMTLNVKFILFVNQEQIQALKEEYGITIDNLRFRLENTELEIDRLRIAARAAQSNSPERDSSPDRPVECSREMKVEERQSGEV